MGARSHWPFGRRGERGCGEMFYRELRGHASSCPSGWRRPYTSTRRVDACRRLLRNGPDALMVFAGVRLPGAHKEEMDMSSSPRRTLGINAHDLATKRKREMHRDNDPQALLAADVVLRFLNQGLCPICDRGPFAAVLTHLNKSHGWGGQEVREYVGVSLAYVFTSPEYHQRRSRLARDRGLPAGAIQKSLKKRRASGRRQTAALRRARAVAKAASVKKAEANGKLFRDQLWRDWDASSRNWEAIHEIAAAMERSPKYVRQVLVNMGADVPDGRADSPKRFWERPKGECEFDDCDRPHVAKGMCRYHWRADRIERGIFTPCSSTGCGKPTVARGLCAAHYAKSRR